jgi:hypothetical protein
MQTEEYPLGGRRQAAEELDDPGLERVFGSNHEVPANLGPLLDPPEVCGVRRNCPQRTGASSLQPLPRKC